MVKQVIVWRKDIKVRKGKFAAQVAHASMKVFFDRMKINSSIKTSCDECSYHYDCKNPDHYDFLKCTYFKPWTSVSCKFTTEMLEWMQGSFTKIVVGCNSLEELLELQKRAEEAGLANAIIEDSGATEFKETCPDCHGDGELHGFRQFPVQCSTCKGTGKIPNPTITCLAIGPSQAEAIDEITGKLELL